MTIKNDVECAFYSIIKEASLLAHIELNSFNNIEKASFNNFRLKHMNETVHYYDIYLNNTGILKITLEYKDNEYFFATQFDKKLNSYLEIETFICIRDNIINAYKQHLKKYFSISLRWENKDVFLNELNI